MDGLEVNGVSLYLAHIPTRKGLAFCFMDGDSLYPVAYVSAKLEDMAIKEWKKMLGEEGGKRISEAPPICEFSSPISF